MLTTPQNVAMFMRMTKIGLRRHTPNFYRILRLIACSPMTYCMTLYLTLMLLTSGCAHHVGKPKWDDGPTRAEVYREWKRASCYYGNYGSTMRPCLSADQVCCKMMREG